MSYVYPIVYTQTNSTNKTYGREWVKGHSHGIYEPHDINKGEYDGTKNEYASLPITQHDEYNYHHTYKCNTDVSKIFMS